MSGGARRFSGGKVCSPVRMPWVSSRAIGWSNLRPILAASPGLSTPFPPLSVANGKSCMALEGRG